jgi:uncharacterized protein YndB with AHSA1/START domain
MADSFIDSLAGAMDGASLAVTARASLRAVWVAFWTAALLAFWMAPPPVMVVNRFDFSVRKKVRCLLYVPEFA